MDISVTPLTVAQTSAVRHLLDRVLDGADVTVAIEGDGGQVLLDQLADRLAPARCRVLRVTAGSLGSLSLSGFMAQVADRPDLAAHDDEVLELGFKALTVLDATCDRIVLLVSDAQALQRGALRYIRFASKSGSGLQVVLAGKPGFRDLLQADEFAYLRERSTAVPVAAGASARPGAAAVAAPLPSVSVASESLAVPGSLTMPKPLARPQPVAAITPEWTEPRRSAPISSPAGGVARPRSRRLWVGVGVAMAASVALGIWIGRHAGQEAPGLAGEASSLDAAATSTQPNVDPAVSNAPGPSRLLRSQDASEEAPSATNGNAAVAPGGAPVREVPGVSSPGGGGEAGRQGAIPSEPSPGAADGANSDRPEMRPPPSQPASEEAVPAPTSPLQALPPAVSVGVKPAVPAPRQAETRSREQAPLASESAARRGGSTQPRVLTRPQAPFLQSAPEIEQPYAGPPFQRPQYPVEVGPRSQPPSQDQPFIGTYTRGADGIRTFRLNP